MPQFVDPDVSQAKFDREIAEYRSLEADYRERGWLLLEATYPSVLVVMVARQLPVPLVVTGVRFDYSNYDVEPPSVRLVNPFTGLPYKGPELPTRLERLLTSQSMQPPGMPAVSVGSIIQPYMQWMSEDDIPFLCMAGVREYHAHPAHSGDRWELHRPSGAGRLVRILEVIHKYGVASISELRVQLQFTPKIEGFLNVAQP